MKVVLVAINFAPEPTGIGLYTKAYAEELSSVGHEVTVVTGLPHYPAWRKSGWDDSGLPYQVKRCRHYIPRRPSAVRRVLYELSFALSAWRALRQLGSTDLAIAVVPTLASAVVTTTWARRRGIRAGVVVQDLMSGASEQAAAGGDLIRRGARFLERMLFASATRVGVVSAAMIGPALANGARPERLVVVPNWPLSADRPMPSRAAGRAELGFGSDEFVCVHAGNMGAKQGLEVVVDAAALAERRGCKIRFLLIGDGNQREALEARARGLRTLEMWPLLDEKQYLCALAGADALLLVQRASVMEMAFPSKITSYARSRTPLVAAVNPESSVGRTLRTAGAALVVPPDAEQLLGAVCGVRDESELRRSLSQGALRYYEEELRPERLRMSFLQFVLDLGARDRTN